MQSQRRPEQDASGKVVCHACGKPFERPGYHWSNGSCDYPKLSAWQESVAVGLMLSDGTLRTHTKYPFIQVYSSNYEFLSWVDEELGWLTTGVSLYRSADQNARVSQNNGYTADPDNYSDVYVMQTRTMPAFEQFLSWYDNGSKKIVDGVVLDKTSMFVWYALDGSLNWDRRYPGSRPYASIGIGQYDARYVERALDASSLSAGYDVSDEMIRFDVDATKDFLSWLPDAVSGIRHKFETSDINEYDRLQTEF